jgi:hypothetical protein
MYTGGEGVTPGSMLAILCIRKPSKDVMAVMDSVSRTTSSMVRAVSADLGGGCLSRATWLPDRNIEAVPGAKSK